MYEIVPKLALVHSSSKPPALFRIARLTLSHSGEDLLCAANYSPPTRATRSDKSTRSTSITASKLSSPSRVCPPRLLLLKRIFVYVSYPRSCSFLSVDGTCLAELKNISNLDASTFNRRIFASTFWLTCGVCALVVVMGHSSLNLGRVDLTNTIYWTMICYSKFFIPKSMPSSERKLFNQVVCSAMKERDILDQDLKMFWDRQKIEIENSKGLIDLHLPLARVRKVMKSDPQVKRLSSDTPILFAKASEVFIKELTLRAWRHTQSSSRQTIMSSDIHEGLNSSETLKHLIDLVSFKQDFVSHKGGQQIAVHQQEFPPANLDVPKIKTLIDFDVIYEKQFNRTAEDYIIIEDFELNPNHK